MISSVFQKFMAWNGPSRTLKIKANPKRLKIQQKGSGAPATKKTIFLHKIKYKSDVFLAPDFSRIFGGEGPIRVRLHSDRTGPPRIA